MESHPPLSDLVEKTLQEIGKLGLSTESKRDYRLAYKRFEVFAKTRDEECYSPDLLRSFLADSESRTCLHAITTAHAFSIPSLNRPTLETLLPPKQPVRLVKCHDTVEKLFVVHWSTAGEVSFKMRPVSSYLLSGDCS